LKNKNFELPCSLPLGTIDFVIYWQKNVNEADASINIIWTERLITQLRILRLLAEGN
jgi:hypothetical protein